MTDLRQDSLFVCSSSVHNRTTYDHREMIKHDHARRLAQAIVERMTTVTNETEYGDEVMRTEILVFTPSEFWRYVHEYAMKRGYEPQIITNQEASK